MLLFCLHAMRKLLVSLFFAVFMSLIFRQYFFGHKILFPSNLLVTAYAPWKYEPVPEYPRGVPNKPIGFDDIRQFFPNRKLFEESLVKGVIPLWNPYIYSGVPFMAAFDTAVWYPLSWIAALLPPTEGWNFLVIIQPVLSFYFMYLFLKSLRFDTRISAFGAFVYTFSGWMVVYWQEILVLEHSFLWLPLALYASNRKDRLGFFLLIFALASSIFGGFLQMSIYVYSVVLLWNMFIGKSKRVYVAIGLSLCVAAIQLVPSIEAFLMSPRGTADGIQTFRSALLPLQHFITLVAPDFWGNPGVYNYFGGPGFYFEKMIYIGVIPFIFFLYALCSKDRQSTFWKILALGALSLGFALPTSWLPYALRIPVLSNSYPTRIFAVYTFSASVLASFGLRSFLKAPNRKKITWIVSVCTIALATVWAWVMFCWMVGHKYAFVVDMCGKLARFCQITSLSPMRSVAAMYATVSFRNLLVPTMFVGVSWMLIVLSKYLQKTVYAAVMFSAVVSSLYFTQKYLQFSDRRFMYPELPVIRQLSSVAGYSRVWGYGDAFIEKNLPQYFGWFSTDGYGYLSSKRYAELLSTIINNGRLGGKIRRSDTDIYEASQRDSMLSNIYRLRIMSLLGVKYIVSTSQSDLFPDSHFTLVWQNEKWRIWEYKAALPRAIFATMYSIRKDAQELVDTLYNPQTNLANTVILEEDPSVSLPPASASGLATIASYGLNSVTIKTNSTSDGFVILTDNYYPGWRAFVDGKQEKIYRADYTFKSVFVPKGAHTVVFDYVPKSIIVGVIVTLVGIVAVFIV